MNTTNDQPAQKPATKVNRKRRIVRWVLTLVGVLLLFLLVVAYALPGILSGGWSKARVLNAVNGSISGTVEIKSMHLSWFGDQTIDGLTLNDPEGGQVANVKHIAVPVGLWSLLWGGRDLGTITVEQPVLTVKSKPGGSNLMQAVQTTSSGTTRPESTEPFKLPVKFKLQLTDGKITASPLQGADVVFDNVNVTVDAAKRDQPLTFDLSTLTHQGALSGKVKATGSVNLTTGQVQANADVNDLPVAGLDTLADQNGLLVAAIGPTLNAHAVITADQTASKLDVNATAANLSITFNGDTTKQVLSGTGEIKLTATPALAMKLAQRSDPHATTALAGDVPVTITIKKLDLPINGFDPSKVAMDVSLQIGAGKLTGIKDAGDVSWSDFAALIRSDNLAEKVQFAANGKFNADGKAGSLVASGDASKLFDDKGTLAIKQAKVDADATLKDLPVALIDRLAGQNGQLVEALGNTLNATAIAQSDGSGHINATINADSPTLSAVLPVTIGERVTLTAPGTITYTAPLALLKKYVTDTSGYVVAVGQPITLAIDAFDMPMPQAGAKPKPADITLHAKLTATDIAINDPADTKPGSKIGPLVLPQIVLKLDGDKLDKPHVTLDTGWTARDGVVARYASTSSIVKLDATTTLDEQFQPGAVAIALDCQAPTRNTQPLDSVALRGEINKGFERFKLTRPATVTYRVLPAFAPASGLVTATIGELDMPLKGFSLSGVKVKFALGVPKMTLSGDERIAGTMLSDGSADGTFDGPTNALKLTANAKTQLPNQTTTGNIAVDADLKNLLDATGKVDAMNAIGTAKVKLTDMPTAFVDALAGQDGLVVAAIGDQVNVDATINAKSAANRTADVVLHSKLLDASGSVAMAQGKPITLTQPASLNWTLQPAAYTKLAGDDMTLTAPVQVAGTINQLSWPMPSANKTNAASALAGAKVDATFTVGKLSLQPKNSKAVASVSDLQLTANSADLSKSLAAKLAGQLGYADQNTQPITGKLDATATLSDLFDAAGKLDLAAVNAKVNAKLADVPTASLDTLAKQDGLIAAALGDKVNIDADATLVGGKGPLLVTLAAPLANAKIPAQLDAGVLTLTDTMSASFMITDKLSRKLIDHPLLKQALRSEKPVTLVVPKDGFKLSLKLLMSSDPAVKQKGIEQIAIGKATLEPGKVIVNNAGLINTLVTLPDTIGKLAKLQVGEAMQGLQKNDIIAWFTPMNITMRDGVVTMSRMDMLLGDNYQVATWGSINLGTSPATMNGQQIAAKSGDMVLGITERALRRVYGVASFKDDPNYVDQFVMRGPLDALSPNTKDLTSRLVFLTAGGAAAKIGGDKVGNIIGDVIKSATEIKTALDKNKKDQTPTPAPYQPYPWPAEDKTTDPQQTQTDNNQQLNQNPQQPPPQQQPQQKPEEKIINDVLKDIFGKKKK